MQWNHFRTEERGGHQHGTESRKNNAKEKEFISVKGKKVLHGCLQQVVPNETSRFLEIAYKPPGISVIRFVE